MLLCLEGNRLRSLGYFALFSLLAGGMAALLLIPEVCAILETDFGDMDFPNSPPLTLWSSSLKKGMY